MEVPRSILEQIYGEITTSVGYLTTVGPVDRGKVSRRRNGEVTKLPSSKLGRAAWRVAALLAPAVPPPPPPPPPPTYKKVAPRTAHAEGGSDARYCVVNQPGVYWDDSIGRYRDDVATYDTNGLSWGGRSNGDPSVGTVGAKSMDGRSPCELPTFGDPRLNTGSWAI